MPTRSRPAELRPSPSPSSGSVPVRRRRRPGVLWWVVALAATAVAVVVVVAGTDAAVLAQAARGLVDDPVPVLAALAAFGAGFAIRAWVWARLVPGLGLGHAWAAVHVSLLGNHVLPLRLGEPLRVLSVVRRAGVGLSPAAASTLTLRSADVVTLLGLTVAAAIWVLGDGLALPSGVVGWPVAAVAAGALAALGAGMAWTRLARRRARATGEEVPVRWPDAVTVAGTLAGWVLEAGIVLVVARAAGVEVGVAVAVLVSGASVLAQVAAVTPGGFGTYEAGAVAAWVLVGVDPATALAMALVTHALSTVYALAVGAVAVAVPAPGELGRWRLPRRLPARPEEVPAAGEASSPAAGEASRPAAAPVVLVLPAHDEEATVADVVRRAPGSVAGRPVQVVVVDDGSSDATARAAAAAGAAVVAHPVNRGLGAAVRTGFAEGVRRGAAAVAFCDADGEYAPEELALLVEPVLAGRADYVVGSRFAGRIDRMHPHRRLGNLVLTAWVRWLTRRRDVTDGQSGYRALSRGAAAAAEIVHDYNYAQVLTLDLLGKGYRYAEVPISYRFRDHGRSFVRLGRYLARVVPAVHRELNGPPGPR